MDRAKIKMLLNLFESQDAEVWVIDKNWKIIGGKYQFPSEQPACELLEIDENCWENTEKEIYLNGYFFHCTLYCNQEEGFRVAVLKEYRAFQKNYPEFIDIKCAVHSLQLMKHQIGEHIQEHPDFAFPNLPDSLERMSLLIYRRYYLQKYIQSVKNRRLAKSPFSLSDMMHHIEKKLSETLADYAEIDFQLPQEEIRFNTNIELFQIIILCGIVLCHHERGYFHHIKLVMNLLKDTVHINLTLTPDLAKSIDISQQIDLFSFGPLREEQTLLTLFCMMHHGKWTMLAPHHIQIYFCVKEARPTFSLHSNSSRVNPSTYENLYYLVLAPVYISVF